MDGATIVRQGQGPSFWILGDRVEFKTPAAASGGRYTMAHTLTVPGGGPPPHRHRNEDEVFYIIDGNFEFLVGDTVVPAPPGTLIFGARNVTHQFRNKGPGNGSFVVWVQPAKFETFISELGTPAAGVVDPPAPTPQLMDKLGRLCQAYGIEIQPDAPQTGMAAATPPSLPRWVLGLQVRVLCGGAESGGTLAVAEIIAPPQAGPPVHLHIDQDEVFYVLDGRFEFVLGDQTLIAETGDAVQVPRQTFHSFKNVGTTTARLLDFHTPAGMEHFFNECAEPTQQVQLAPQRIVELCEKHGMKVR
jgi:mannose-6-phosphate isomerase-like protein (cupin superfamily)